jgi:hypothetical protein
MPRCPIEALFLPQGLSEVRFTSTDTAEINGPKIEVYIRACSR